MTKNKRNPATRTPSEIRPDGFVSGGVFSAWIKHVEIINPNGKIGLIMKLVVCNYLLFWFETAWLTRENWNFETGEGL